MRNYKAPSISPEGGGNVENKNEDWNEYQKNILN
jgi:hypothetical protein